MKPGDTVKIKAEWCDGEADRVATWRVIEVYDSRCVIALTDHSHPLGLQQLVSLDMIYSY